MFTSASQQVLLNLMEDTGLAAKSDTSSRIVAPAYFGGGGFDADHRLTNDY
jgi:hypothetical protein